MQRFCADAGYRKTFELDVFRELGLGVDISVRIKPEWEILPKRWIVERSLQSRVIIDICGKTESETRRAGLGQMAGE